MSDRVRVTGGRFRGRQVPVGPRVRPTEGRVREALFSIWQPRLGGAVVLDLFAGSGVVALESLGRGAERVVLVEGDPRIARDLRSTLAGFAGKGEAVLLRGRLPAALAVVREKNPEGFDLAFADPPYAFRGYESLADQAAALLRPGGELAIEHSVRTAIDPARLECAELVDQRDYGETRLSFFRPRVEAQATS